MATKQEVKRLAEQDLWAFATLINPQYVYGDIHKECFRWLANGDLDQLLLLPRGHLKSHMIAVWCAWWITKHPDASILYVSGTEDLAVLQLSAIKGIFEHPTYRKYWPDMIHPKDSMRAEWSAKNIQVDHPYRKEMGTRDRTVAARSIDGNTTGLHASVLVFDDIVLPSNAYTMEGRRKVAAGYSLFASVANTGSVTKVVGTRYHGKDVYGEVMMKEVEEIFDDEGNLIDEKPVYNVMERCVEEDNIFLWPRARHPTTGRWEGFNRQELAKKRARYFAAGERSQYYAQYYNDPNSMGDEDVISEFTYFDERYLSEVDGQWYFKDLPLAIYAAGDLAYTTADTSDYTAFAVIGMDPDGFIYILDLDQLKTKKYSTMYNRIERLYLKWHFRTLRLETNAGANLVAEYVKDEVRRMGHALIVNGKPAKGEKYERTQMILLPRYENGTIIHKRGGYISTYEEQIILPRPSHDDLRDAVAAAVEEAKPPGRRRRKTEGRGQVIQFDSRFGGRLR